MKIYIRVRKPVAPGFAILGAAHASLACYLKFNSHPDTAAWLSGPFHKVICRVNDADFDRSKVVEDYVVITESKLDHAEVAIAFRPRAQWPEAFRYFRLYR